MDGGPTKKKHQKKKIMIPDASRDWYKVKTVDTLSLFFLENYIPEN